MGERGEGGEREGQGQGQVRVKRSGEWRRAPGEARPHFAYPRPLSTQTVEESDSLVVRYTSRHGCPDADDCRSTPAAAPRAVGFASGCENEPSTFSLKSNDAPCFPATHRARHTKSVSTGKAGRV